MSELLRIPSEIEPFKNDYLRVVLEDREELFEPMHRLKQCYPNIMLLERSMVFANKSIQDEEDILPTHVKAAPIDLFQQFYSVIYADETPSEDMLAMMTDILDEAGRMIE